MSLKLTSSISFKTGVYLLVTTSVLVVASSMIFYQKTYLGELNKSRAQLQQLIKTVEKSASIAAFLMNHELAKDITLGLSSNTIVKGVSLKSAEVSIASKGDYPARDVDELIVYKLYSPFMPDERVGALEVIPNKAHIEQRSRDVAFTNTALSIFTFIFVILVVIYVVYRLLTRPLINIASELNELQPGTEERIAVPQKHKNDEIGLLVRDTNQLLSSFQESLNVERKLRNEIELLEKQFRLIFEHASSGIGLFSREGGIRLYNEAFSKLVDVPKIELSKNSENVPHVTFGNFFGVFDEPSVVSDAFKKASNSKVPIEIDVKLKAEKWLHLLLSSVSDENGEGLIECIAYDISERVASEKKVRDQAEQDSLTKLFNRYGGLLRIQQIMEAQEAQRESNAEPGSSDSKLAVFLIDLDGFKPINDTYGHDAGDRVLVDVSKSLKQAVRENDLVIRWGGDEFVVVTSVRAEKEVPGCIAQKILKQLDKEIDLGQGVLGRVGASIGVAVYPDHGDNIDELIEKADEAMYHVKRSGKNAFSVYQSDSI